ncbi:MAG: SDR family oxidoreductase [Hyphomicrobiales bacterium]|nr:SDR family oxidoreductase [Hyphomicrobiales bacterium]
MSKMLEGKVVLVTGAGRGVGREIAIMSAAYGAKVVVNDLGVSVSGADASDAPASEVVETIRKAGGEAVANFDSVADKAGALSMVAAAVDNFGRIDVVVNNAGILRDVIFHKMTDNDWDSVIKTHLYGAFNVSSAAAAHFREQQSGVFVHMTSTSGLIGNTGQANYMAAKLGIVGLSKSLALDMRRFGVRSNCISPFAWSRMVGSIPNTPDQQERLESLRSLTPDKIASVAVFLASDAAAEVTGQIFGVRKNEVFLFSQPRPIRTMHRAEGWTPETLVEQLLPGFKPSFVPLDVTQDVFGWQPI